MFFYTAVYNLIMIKLIVSTDSYTQKPLVFNKTLIFDGPLWTKIDKDVFQNYPFADTLIINNTNILSFPQGIHLLYNLHTIECKNNLQLSIWIDLYQLSSTTKSKITKIILESNKRNIRLSNIHKFENLKHLTMRNSYQPVDHKLNFIFQCKELTFLDLSDNDLEIVPENIYKLHNLKHLDLSKNGLKEISNKIGRLTQIKTLNLSNNQIANLPECFYDLKNIKRLNLSSNSLDHVSLNINKLKNLQSLDLSKNKLQSLPPEFCTLQQLETLNLSGNLFSNIPAPVMFLKQLKRLFVNNNAMISVLPNILQLNEIKNIDFNSKNQSFIQEHEINQFNKPEQYDFLINLILLDVSNNQLTEIANSIINFKNLQFLNASYNNILSFPINLSSWPALYYLNLRRNELTQVPCINGSNVKLNISRNFINIDKIKQRENEPAYFHLIDCLQYKNKISYENVVNQYKMESLYWNLTSLTCITVNYGYIYGFNLNISDSIMIQIWKQVIQYFIYDVPSNINNNYECSYDTSSEITVKLDQILQSGIIQLLKQDIHKTNDISIIKLFTNRLSDTFCSEYTDKNNQIKIIFKSHVKAIFKSFIDKIIIAGNDSFKIKKLRVYITKLCRSCVNTPLDEAVEQLIHACSLQYCIPDQQYKRDFVSFIYSQINEKRENTFYEMYRKCYSDKIKEFGSVRNAFTNRIGIYDVLDNLRENYYMTEFETGDIMQSFLNKFSVKDIAHKILIEINAEQNKVIQAMKFLTKNNKNDLFLVSKAPTKIYLPVKMNDEKIIRVKQAYFKSTTYGNGTVLYSLTIKGMIQILADLQLVIANESQNN